MRKTKGRHTNTRSAQHGLVQSSEFRLRSEELNEFGFKLCESKASLQWKANTQRFVKKTGASEWLVNFVEGGQQSAAPRPTQGSGRERDAVLRHTAPRSPTLPAYPDRDHNPRSAGRSLLRGSRAPVVAATNTADAGGRRASPASAQETQTRKEALVAQCATRVQPGAWIARDEM